VSQFEFIDPERRSRATCQTSLDPDDQRYRLFGRLKQQMQDPAAPPRQHSGGMVVAGPARRSCRSKRPMPGRVVVQWDGDDCADQDHQSICSGWG
jgi:error-prone DNA polymerase